MQLGLDLAGMSGALTGGAAFPAYGQYSSGSNLRDAMMRAQNIAHQPVPMMGQLNQKMNELSPGEKAGVSGGELALRMALMAAMGA